MKKFYFSISIILLIIIGFLIWFGFSNRSTPTTGEPIKIGLVTWIGHELYYVAEEKGFFDAEDVQVELVSFDTTSNGKQLIASGRIDAISLNPDALVGLADAGLKVKAIAITDFSDGADGVIVRDDINKVSDLRDKSIAFEVGSASHFLLEYGLNQEGLSSEDLQVVDANAGDAAAAFFAGKVDAAVTWEPWLSSANKDGGGKILFSTKDFPVLPAILIVNDDVLKNRRADFERILEAIFSAQEWINNNESEAVRIMAKNLNITEEEVREQLETDHFVSYEENLEMENNRYLLDIVGQASSLWFERGFIEKEFEPSDLIDFSVINNIR